jgi:hypothetical protein
MHVHGRGKIEIIFIDRGGCKVGAEVGLKCDPSGPVSYGEVLWVTGE